MRRPGQAAAVLALPIAAALAVGACGSGGGYGTGNGAAGTSPAGTGAASAGATTIGTRTGTDGTFLTGASGRTIYLWTADTSGRSTCSGACAAAWPPVTTSGAPRASGSAKGADLGTTTRSDGSDQVTYDGHPLYYYAGDGAAGATTGQGSNSFGAVWWLVAPSGAAITGGGGAPAPAGTSTGSQSSPGGGGYGPGY